MFIIIINLIFHFNENIQYSGKSDGIIVDGRMLNITVAVERNEASKLSDSNKKKKEDKRHLYLSNEGNFSPSFLFFSFLYE